MGVGVERQVRSILLFSHCDFQITNFYVVDHQQSNISNKMCNNYFIIKCCVYVSGLIQLVGGESNI